MTSVKLDLDAADLRIARGSVPASTQLAEALKAHIVAQRLPHGGRLPSERELIDRSGLSRVTVREASTGAFVPKVQVKVIGTGNTSFLSGETELRGVFVAEGVQGQATAVALAAFFSGTETPPVASSGRSASGAKVITPSTRSTV